MTTTKAKLFICPTCGFKEKNAGGKKRCKTCEAKRIQEKEWSTK